MQEQRFANRTKGVITTTAVLTKAPPWDHQGTGCQTMIELLIWWAVCRRLWQSRSGHWRGGPLQDCQSCNEALSTFQKCNHALTITLQSSSPSWDFALLVLHNPCQSAPYCVDEGWNLQ